MSELIPLDNLGDNLPELNPTEESNFGGTLEDDYDDDDSFDSENPDMLSGLDFLSQRWNNWTNREAVTIDNSDFEFNRYFDGNLYEARNIAYFIRDIMDKSREYEDPRFIKYLIDKHNFKIKKTINAGGVVTKYEVEYYGKPYINEEGLEIRPVGEFKTDDAEMETDADFHQCNGDIDYLYDKWKDEILKKKIKKASLVGGVIIAIAGLVSGLSLGLKRSGHSMVHDSKMKWKKLTPAEKKHIVIPWTELEKASGKDVILIGDYLYVLIGGTILIYLIKNRT